MKEEREEISLLIKEAQAAGARQSEACKIVGISAKTLQRWILSKTADQLEKYHHQPNGQITLEDRKRGFNSLKNGGYGLEHKYSRVSYQASKNYYQLMQIAHLINQLMINSTRFQKAYFSTKNHPTLKFVGKLHGCNEVS